MAVPVVGDKYLVTAVGSLCNQTIMNTFWFRLVNVGAFATVISLYDAIHAVFNAGGGVGDLLNECYPGNLFYNYNWVQRVQPIRIMKNVYSVAETGSQNEAATANIQASIERRGEVAIKKAVGAIRIPIDGSDVNAANGLITNDTLKDALTALAAEMKLDLTGGALGTAVLRPIVYQPYNNPGGLGYEVVRTTVMDTVRVIRRRTVGLGI